MTNIFSCKRCGFCCQGETTVSLDAEDQKRMLQHLEITEDEAFAKFWRRSDGQVQMKIADGHCIFFVEGCTVHPARPWRCRQWPLVPAILVDRNALESIRNSCPGISKAATYAELCDTVRKTSSELSINIRPKADKNSKL